MPTVTLQVDIYVFDTAELINFARATPFFQQRDLMEGLLLIPDNDISAALHYAIMAREPIPGTVIINLRATVHGRH